MDQPRIGGPSGAPSSSSARPPASSSSTARPPVASSLNGHPSSGPTSSVPPLGGSSSSAQLRAAPLPIPASPAAPIAEARLSTPAEDKDDDDDSLSDLTSESDVDMTGPEQVGGGPLSDPRDPQGPPPAPLPAAAPSRVEQQQPGQVGNTPQSSPAISAGIRPTTETQTPSQSISARPSVPPSTSNAVPIRTPQSAAQIVAPPPSQIPNQSSNPSSFNPGFRPPSYPSQPRRIYPLPPPFLLVAFKDAPTEKYLLPLGSQSYISRVGGDIVTSRPKPAVSLPATSSMETAAPVDQPMVNAETKPSKPKGKPKTKGKRALLSRKKAVEILEPEPEPSEESEDDEPLPATPVEEKLPVLPGSNPDGGTVLVSTIVPVEKWLKPDWTELGKRLPFEHRDFDLNPITLTPISPVESKREVPMPVPASPAEGVAPSGEGASSMADPDSASGPSTNSTSTRPLRQYTSTTKIAEPAAKPPSSSKPVKKTPKPSVLNLGALSFLPAEGGLQPVTIRLAGLSDNAWRRVQKVVKVAEEFEMAMMARDEPELREIPPAKIAPAPSPAPAGHSSPAPAASSTQPRPTTGGPNAELKPSAPAEEGPTLLRRTWLQRRKELFEMLVSLISVINSGLCSLNYLARASPPKKFLAIQN